MFPDSTAAKGDKPKRPGAPAERAETTEEQASNRQLAFAYLMRGVHW
jgi:hypothetical protein